VLSYAEGSSRDTRSLGQSLDTTNWPRTMRPKVFRCPANLYLPRHALWFHQLPHQLGQLVVMRTMGRHVGTNSFPMDLFQGERRASA